MEINLQQGIKKELTKGPKPENKKICPENKFRGNIQTINTNTTKMKCSYFAALILIRFFTF